MMPSSWAKTKLESMAEYKKKEKSGKDADYRNYRLVICYLYDVNEGREKGRFGISVLV